MEHGKRSMMQQKVELSTLLRIVIATKKSRTFRVNGKNAQDLIKALASEAIESLKNCDRSEIDVKPGILHAKDSLAINRPGKFYIHY